ncbi:MAG: manganese efflux pump [Firmicutes bacterium]|nr:manganese efflux pump [Bacillota bacterium]
MLLAELILTAIGLAMDAFAVSICKGLALQKLKFRHMLLAGLYFGVFQALMPLIGYYLGSIFSGFIEKIDHWVAFVLLLWIGIRMIREGLSAKDEEADADFSVKTMLILAVATSIDALAVGISFAVLSVRIIPAVSLIGIITFVICFAGVWIGHVFGSKLNKGAEVLGGSVLILIGVKILLEHLGIFSF